MKKARQVAIPEDRTLDSKTFYDLSEHAYNSASWYAQEYSRTEAQIVEKLLSKGYVRGEITVTSRSGEAEEHDIIEETLERLRSNLIVDDRRIATNYARRELERGVGARMIYPKLLQKGVSPELIAAVLEELQEERDDEDVIYAVDKAAQRILRSSAYLKLEDTFAQRRRLTQGLMGKGFGFDEIKLWEEAQMDS